MKEHELCECLVALEPRLFLIARQYLSCYADQQDAVQECFCKVWAHKDSIRQPEYICTWIVRILINECVNIQRKQAACLPLNPERLIRRGSSDEIDSAIERADLERALSAVNEVEKQIIYLRYYEGYPLPQIADMTNVSKGAVSSRLYRSLKKLSTHIIAS